MFAELDAGVSVERRPVFNDCIVVILCGTSLLSINDRGYLRFSYRITRHIVK
jgi:hypothetical protein